MCLFSVVDVAVDDCVDGDGEGVDVDEVGVDGFGEDGEVVVLGFGDDGGAVCFRSIWC